MLKIYTSCCFSTFFLSSYKCKRVGRPKCHGGIIDVFGRVAAWDFLPLEEERESGRAYCSFLFFLQYMSYIALKQIRYALEHYRHASAVIYKDWLRIIIISLQLLLSFIDPAPDLIAKDPRVPLAPIWKTNTPSDWGLGLLCRAELVLSDIFTETRTEHWTWTFISSN